MEKPQGALGLPGTNEKRRIVRRSGYYPGVVAECSLYKRPTTVSVPLLDQVVYLRIGQLKRCCHLGNLRGFRQVVDKGICCKRKRYFSGREFIEDP